VPSGYWRDHFCDLQTTFVTQPLSVTVSPETLIEPLLVLFASGSVILRE
jgi:hypothetical protein